MSKFQPLYDRVIIEPISQSETTSGGIYLPESAKSTPTKGKVIAIGHGYRNENGELSALSVAVNDIVIYGQWSGTKIQDEESKKELIIMKESDILAKIS